MDENNQSNPEESTPQIWLSIYDTQQHKTLIPIARLHTTLTIPQLVVWVGAVLATFVALIKVGFMTTLFPLAPLFVLAAFGITKFLQREVEGREYLAHMRGKLRLMLHPKGGRVRGRPYRSLTAERLVRGRRLFVEQPAPRKRE